MLSSASAPSSSFEVTAPLKRLTTIPTEPQTPRTEPRAGRRWGDIAMAEVATRAGVSRQTLYKTFGSREAFAQLVEASDPRPLGSLIPAQLGARAGAIGFMAVANAAPDDGARLRRRIPRRQRM